MAARATGKAAGEQVAGPPAAATTTSVAIAAAPAPPPGPAGFAANHPLPAGFTRLVCVPGSETAPVGFGDRGFEAYREHGPGRAKWLIDVPREAAFHLIRAGFRLYDPAEPP